MVNKVLDFATDTFRPNDHVESIGNHRLICFGHLTTHVVDFKCRSSKLPASHKSCALVPNRFKNFMFHHGSSLRGGSRECHSVPSETHGFAPSGAH